MGIFGQDEKVQKVLVFRKKNRILSRPTLGESDGTSIRVEKWREEYIIKAEAYGYNKPNKLLPGTRSMNAYIVDANSTISVEIPHTKPARRVLGVDIKGKTETYTLRGVTVDLPDLAMPKGVMLDADGNAMDISITSSHVFERSESSDIKRFNLAAGIPWLMIVLGMGAGGAICMLIALGLMAWGKLQIG